MKTATFLGMRGISVLLTILFISFISAGQVKIHESISITPRATATQLSDPDTSFTLTMPFDGRATVTVLRFEGNGISAILNLNGNSILRIVGPTESIPLGDFRKNETLTFVVSHDDGSPWLGRTEGDGGECYESHLFGFGEMHGTVSSGVQFIVEFYNSITEKILRPNWNGKNITFGEITPIQAAYTNICWGNETYPLPEGTTFTFSITEGQRYANLHDPITGTEADTLSGLSNDNGVCAVDLITVGDEPTGPVYVTVEARTSASGVNTCSGRIKINLADLIVTPTKSSITYGDNLRSGDTLSISVAKRMPDGTKGPLEEGTILFYSIIEGNDAGYLSSPDGSDVGDMIYGDYTTATFTAVEETQQDDITRVRIKVEAYLGGGLPVKVKPKPDTTQLAGTKESNQISPREKKLIGINPFRKNGTQVKQTIAKAASEEDGAYVGYTTFYVAKSVCVFVRPGKNTLALGEVTPLLFDRGKVFDVFLFGPEGESGKLVAGSTGETGTILYSVYEPIYYVAPSSISTDTVTVYFSALTWNKFPGGGPANSVHTPPMQLLKTTSKSNVMNSRRINNRMQFMGIGCVMSSAIVVDTVHHFLIKAMRDTVTTTDTIGYKECARLFVQAQNKDSNAVRLDTNALLKLSLLTNTGYGTFIKSNGDTLKTTPVQLLNVHYGDLKAGRIQFAAVKKNPDSLVTCKIRVEMQNDTTKKGDTIVVVLGKKLKIQDHSPWTIWPYLPPQNNGESRGADRPGYNPKRAFTIQLKEGIRKPLPNQQINIFTKFEEGSGGHGHTGFADELGTNPAIKSLQPALQGLFYYNGGKVGQNPLTVTTDTNGIAVVDSFIASQASG